MQQIHIRRRRWPSWRQSTLPLYAVRNRHDEAQCAKAFEAFGAAVDGTTAHVRDFYCTCPHGDHWGVMILDAEDEGEAESFGRSVSVGETTVQEADALQVDDLPSG